MNSPTEKIIEILKEKYQYENERKRYYDNVITLPVSLLAFVVAGTYVILNENIHVKWFLLIKPWLIYPLIISTVISMFFLFRVFFGIKRKYCTFPNTSKVLSDFENIKSYYIINHIEHTEKDIDDDVNTHLITWYKDINENNIEVNDTRMNNFHYSKFSIGLSYLLGILVFSSFCIAKLDIHKPMAKTTTVQSPPPPPKPAPSPVRREKADKPDIKKK